MIPVLVQFANVQNFSQFKSPQNGGGSVHGFSVPKMEIKSPLTILKSNYTSLKKDKIIIPYWFPQSRQTIDKFVHILLLF